MKEKTAATTVVDLRSKAVYTAAPMHIVEGIAHIAHKVTFTTVRFL